MPRGNPELAKAMGGRMASRRKELGLTQENVADLAGIAYQQYNKAENGKTCLSSDSLHRISKALDVSADFLLTGFIGTNPHNEAIELLEQMTESQRKLAQVLLQDIVKFGAE